MGRGGGNEQAFRSAALFAWHREWLAKPRIEAWVTQAEDVIRHALTACAATQATVVPAPSPFVRLDEDDAGADRG